MKFLIPSMICGWLGFATAGETGKLHDEKWLGIPGATIADLTSHPNFPDSPSTAGVIAVDAIYLTGGLDNCGRRLSGFLKAPKTGWYTFWVSGDESCELWLSNGPTAGGRQKIAESLLPTGWWEWDKYVQQKSVPIFLKQGDRYYIEMLQKEAAWADHVEVAWQIPDGQRQSIPASAFESYGIDPNDLDNDGLPDAWEATHQLSSEPATGWQGNNGATGDPDGDGFSNRDELLAGGNPTIPDPLPGGLKREVWSGIPGATVWDLTSSPYYSHSPMVSGFMPGASAPVNYAENYGQRLRGYVDIPVSGSYRFYVAADDNAELWISTDGTPFNKQRVAAIYGDRWTSQNQWDKYFTQRSAPIALAQGQRIYVELLQKENVYGDNLSLGWALGDAVPDLVPSTNLHAFAVRADDLDDDGLNDSWEAYHGFRTDDNGIEEPSQSALGDADGDGISNFDEMRLGSDPFLSDGAAGYWERSVWSRVPGINVQSLTYSSRFNERPVIRDLVPDFTVGREIGMDEGAYRFRARVTAPVTGTYTVRTTGADATEVWWSTSGSKFDRRLIATAPEATEEGRYDRTVIQQGTVTLVAGQSYFVEVFQKHGWGPARLSVQWKSPGASTFTDLTGTSVRSHVVSADDPDDDDLSTAWELAHGFDPAAKESGDKSPNADPDGDGVSNRDECLGGGNPFVNDSPRGVLLTERWNHGIPYFSVHEALDAGIYLSPPTSVQGTYQSTWVPLDTNMASRTRGKIVAPATGNYRFWVSGGTAVELYLSTDGNPYAKRRIARIGPEIGMGAGIINTGSPEFDLHMAQQSEEIPLLAGQSYYIEIITQTSNLTYSHVGIAWARDNGPRTSLSFEAMSAYSPGSDDMDDDSLPDSWETTCGLNPNDNGITDFAREGERGDYDSDGLTNREEYLVGTDPCNSDSDGDGISDGEEIRSRGTNPLVSSPVLDQVVGSLPLTPASSSGTWTLGPDGSLMADAFRGSAIWNFTVPSDGVYVIEIATSLTGINLYREEELRLESRIDGKVASRSDTLYVSGQAAPHRMVTPFLKAGSHELGLLVDNYITRRKIQIHRISVIKRLDVDGNYDGIPDLLAAHLHAENGVLPHVTYSHVSPFFIEGQARDPAAVDLTVITRSGEVNRTYRYNPSQWQSMLPGFEQRLSSYRTNLIQQLRNGGNRMEGYQVSHLPGAGRSSWYSFLELSRNEAIGYVALFENNAFGKSGTVVWTPYNVLQGGEMTVPLGSKVLLGAWASEWDWQTVTLTTGGQSQSFPSAQSQVHQFDTAGTYQVVATHPNGSTGTLTVHVRTANFGSAFNVVEQRLKKWDMNGVPFELALDGGKGGATFQNETQLASGGTRATVLPSWPGNHRVVARLNEGGPVLATGTVHVSGLSDALKNYDSRSIGVEDGIVTIESPLVIANLPVGGYAKVVIFRAGVTFQDGSTERILTASDFDENGMIKLIFLSPVNLPGGFCHYFEIYDAGGSLVFRS